MSMVIVVLLIAASLAGGVYVGYQSGSDNVRLQLEPELQRQTSLNANITKQNEALNQAIVNASQLGIVKIGYIAPTLTDKEQSTRFIEEIVQPDINAYASKLGYNVTFQFTIKTVDDGQQLDHLTKVQELQEMGVDLVISGGWSSMLDLSFNYVNNNNMLLVGTLSTSPLLSFPNDRLYRMIPPDSTFPSQLASIMLSYGVKSVIILQRADLWFDIVAGDFETAWKAKGGSLAGKAIRYPVSDFSAYLQTANRQAQAAKEVYPESGKVAILLLAFDEDEMIVTEMEKYLPLYDCVLFSIYSHIDLKTDAFIGSPQASHLKVFTTAAQPFTSSIYSGLKVRYPSIDEQDAFLYDGAWAIVASVLEARSVNASVVNGVFPDVCGRLFGASGWCRLDEYGDRASLPMDVWYYSGGSRVYAGFYEPDTDTMNWNIGD